MDFTAGVNRVQHNGCFVDAQTRVWFDFNLSYSRSSLYHADAAQSNFVFSAKNSISNETSHEESFICLESQISFGVPERNHQKQWRMLLTSELTAHLSRLANLQASTFCCQIPQMKTNERHKSGFRARMFPHQSHCVQPKISSIFFRQKFSEQEKNKHFAKILPSLFLTACSAGRMLKSKISTLQLPLVPNCEWDNQGSQVTAGTRLVTCFCMLNTVRRNFCLNISQNLDELLPIQTQF